MKLTKEQQKALSRKWVFWNDGKSYLSFRRTVFQGLGMDGAAVVPWNGMMLVIETDGYTHS